MNIEPELPLDDIQGMVVPGFLKPHQALIYLAVPEGALARDRLCKVLQQMLSGLVISSGRTTLHDRRTFRRGRHPRQPLAALGFSALGLNKLSNGLHSSVPSPAYQVGLGVRAGLLGDPEPSTCWHADFGSRQQQPDALLVFAGDTKEQVKAMVDAWLPSLTVTEDDIPLVQYGDAFDRGREHFGFADGISQPGIRGRRNRRPGAYITRRHLLPEDPEHDLFGLPGQNLVWPGEFVLGWPASSPDPRIPGPVRPVPDWMRNGSFLVYRRLRQDVAGFRQWVLEQADGLRDFPGFSHLGSAQRSEKLGAYLVGRWPSGAPLSRAPDHDIPALGRNRQLNNDFRFDDDTPRRTQGPHAFPPLPHASADILGVQCPVSAHIRKVNVRDQASDVGGASATLTRRILRVGVPYGSPLPQNFTSEQAAEDRGLLFLSIQASIEEQFEFLQARWINSGSRPRGPGGHDMMVGQSAATPDGERRCRIFSADMSRTAEIVSKLSFVRMTGGGYFFMPSMSALGWLVSQGRQSG